LVQTNNGNENSWIEPLGIFRCVLLVILLFLILGSALIVVPACLLFYVGIMAWSRLEKATRKPAPQPLNVSGKATIQDRVVRVFIASTFEDMQAERDILIRNVFPRLNQHFRSEGVSIIPVDLRWGLPQIDVDNRDLAGLCLSRIDNCRPYFLGLIGNRYGTVLESFCEADLADHPWLDRYVGHSILDLEITHGVLNEPGTPKRVFLYSRENYFEDKLADSGGNDIDGANIEALKARIESAGFRIDDYMEPSELSDIFYEEFSSILNEDLKHFGLSQPDKDLDGMLQRYHHSEHLNSYVFDPENIACIDRYLDTGGKPLLIVGEYGAGKSSLIAGYANLLRSNPRPHAKSAIINFGRSEHLATTLRQIMAQLKTIVDGLPEPPVSDVEVTGQFAAWLTTAARNTVIVLLIDNICDLLQKNTIGRPLFPWLPNPLPASIRLVATCEPFRALALLEGAEWQCFTLSPITAKTGRRIVKRYFDHYLKSIDHRHLEALAAASNGQPPLYLQLLLNEIRVFGFFEDMDAFIRTLVLVPDLKALYHRLFDRLERDNTLYSEEWNRLATSDEPWWIYIILSVIAESPVPFGEEDERHLMRQLFRNQLIQDTEYPRSFIGLAQDLGIVEYYNDSFVISSPLVRKVLRERKLYPQAMEKIRTTFAPSQGNTGPDKDNTLLS